MTTAELAQHVARLSRVRDVADCDIGDKHEIALVLSSALGEYYTLAPASYRQTAVSRTLPAPETFSLTVHEEDNTVAGSPFTPEQRGCTILIDGDPRPNEIVGFAELLNDYAGLSGTVSATVYYDCLAMLDFSIERVTTDVEILDEQGRAIQLTLLDGNARSPRMEDAYRYSEQGQEGVSTRLLDVRSIDRRRTHPHPGYYWLEKIGGSRQTNPDGVFQLRLWPMPTQRLTVNFEAEIFPLPVTIAELADSPRDLPVPDSVAQRTLVPLARALMLESVVVDPEISDRAARGVESAGDRARDQIRTLTPLWTSSHVTAGTPAGW